MHAPPLAWARSNSRSSAKPAQPCKYRQRAHCGIPSKCCYGSGTGVNMLQFTPDGNIVVLGLLHSRLQLDCHCHPSDMYMCCTVMYCSTANHPKAACAPGTAHQIAFSCSWSGALSLTSIPANKAATSSHYSGADSALGGAKCAAWRTTVASPPIGSTALSAVCAAHDWQQLLTAHTAFMELLLLRLPV